MVAALAGARLLVPVVAVLDEAEVGADGLRRDKDSHMATVSLLNPDGRRGLLAFTSTATLAAWQSDARPVAATSQRVAQAALQEGADAVLLDVAGSGALPDRGGSAAGAGPPAPPGTPRTATPRCTPPYGPWRASPCSPSRDELRAPLRPAGPGCRRWWDALGALADRLAADPALQLRCPRGIAVALDPAPAAD